MQTREQLYAAKVYDLVDGYRKQQGKTLKETEPSKREEELKAACKRYGSMAHKLPVLIRTAGLAQALAFVEARGKPEHLILLGHLEDALKYSGTLTSTQKIVARSRAALVEEYMRLTEEALAALLWFKRYAQSVLGVEATDDDNGEAGDDANKQA